MELHVFADQILMSDSLAEKLKPAEQVLTDNQPGEPQQIVQPVRPANLQFAPRRTAPAMPKPEAFADPQKRAVAHHIMANHELQALEVMAYVLKAFPQAPQEFRLGLVQVMHDEQQHTRMHMHRCRNFGMDFGDLPVNCYIWQKAMTFTCVLDYLAGLPLTFEGRNLDHTLEFEEYFQQVGDSRSAQIMRKIHEDEIEHVRFGITWLQRLKPAHLSDWEAYVQHLHWPLNPDKSCGNTFHDAPRLAAGLSHEFVSELAARASSGD